MDENSTVLDEKERINEYLKSFRSLWRFTNDFKKIKSTDSDAIEKLEKAISRIPEIDILGSEIEKHKLSCQEFINKIKIEKVKDFKKHETGYIKEMINQGKIVREYSGGWRINKFQLNTKPEFAKCRILYNGEVVIKWSNINSKEDFIELEEKADSMLNDAIIPKEQLVELFWEAYTQGIFRLNSTGDPKILPIHDLYKEFRIALIRKHLESKKITGKINKYLEFPLWNFLYNMDMYRMWGSEIPDNKKIVLQTGSMQETSKGKGFIVNGINANEEYKVMCYAYAYKGGTEA
ncbi:MAG: hypothetical protein GX925_01165 [Clostridiales bacterium]|nr:hypothetical protein [Clostridiales bacterium]